jgi:polyhydroxyalkanoate synthesis repressor PhaR
MIRLIKRYESRKLYDTEESRYVSLEEIAGWVRQGQEVKVVDNATAADITSQTLTQIILDEGRKGTSSIPSELLHELVRLGERAVHSGVEQVQNGVGRLVQASIDRLGPVRRAREEMSSLRTRLEQLEASLAALDSEVLVGMAEGPETAAAASAAASPAGTSAVTGAAASGNGSAVAGGAAASVPGTPARPAAGRGDHGDHEVGQ